MKKTLTAILLCTALCVTTFAQNASDFTVDANGVITNYSGFDTVVVIPATINGKKITGIGAGVFQKSDLTSVTIPNGVTYIGEEAFSSNRLTSVTIPGSVKTILNSAFQGNPLAAIVIPEGVETIEWDAFADTKCASVSLPSTVRSIGDDAFDTSGNPSFTLTANINAIFDANSYPLFYSYIANDRKAGNYAFDLPAVSKEADGYRYIETRYGAVLTEYRGDSSRVRVPSEIGGIVVKALYGTPDRYDGFGGVFSGKSLAAVQIPEGITYIGQSAFSRNKLTSVTIPNSVTYIGEEAFRENKLTGVTIPNGVTFIGYKAFSDNQLTSVTIGTGVTYIGERAFLDNKLTGVTIPNGVTYIGDSAFRDNQLTSVTFQGTITATNFHSDAFYGLGDLRAKYLAGGRGRYTRPNTSSNTWTKQ